MGAIFDSELHQIDDVTTFLRGTLINDVCIEVSGGGTEHDKHSAVCGPEKALSWLKNVPKRGHTKTELFQKDLNLSEV